ncbi:MAG: hypothetical protein ACRDA3_10285 [Peptostreptococcaceae bacterium]
MKLDKRDKKIGVISIIVGIILNLFIDKAFDVVLMLLVVYAIHKYIGNIEYYDELYCKERNVEYLNKEKYFEKLKKSIIIIDVYIAIKIIFILATKMGGFAGLEILLLGEFISVYADILGRKYIKSIDGVEIERKIKFANNKVLLFCIMIAFVVTTFKYSSNFIQEDNYIKTKDYEYKLSYKNDSRIVELSGDSFYHRAAESDKNTIHFDKYIKDCKALVNMKALENYSKVGMVFMLILVISQMRFKEKNKKANTVAVHIFLIGAIVFGSITFNTYSIDLEYNIHTDFAEKSLY